MLNRLLVAVKERNFFLFRKNTDEMRIWQKILFWLYQNIMLILAGVAVGAMSLLYAFGTFSREMFWSYFDNAYIAVLNIAPVLVLLYFIYLLSGRAWVAYLSTSAFIWLISVINMNKIILRNDPVVFEDIVNVSTALRVVGEQDYNITFNRKVILGLLMVIVGTLFFLFLVRGKLNWKLRLPLAVLPIIISVSCWHFYTDDNIYNFKTSNIELINQWNQSQQYYSKGFIYPLLHSSKEFFVAPPEGYSEEAAEQALNAYKDADIPEDEKVNIFFIQREAYSDLSLIEGIEGIDFSMYDTYHELMDESYSGRLFTNIFAGGTIDSERSIMIGAHSLKNYRSATNSYVRYMAEQGYTVEGGHPSYKWFYNRQNINKYLGFENYYFLEDRYGDFVKDGIFYDDLITLFEERDASKPYFNFSVTYQGHGPYGTYWSAYPEADFVSEHYSEYSTYVLNNYLGSLEDSDRQLADLFDYFRESDEPVIFCVYGDHKPWLGDNNYVYDEMGINLDLSTQEGLMNYYSTEYMIWANDAAKAAVGFDFVGEGPTLSPFYMMNLLFDLCGWDGPAYMQLMDGFMETLPVASSTEYYMIDGELVMNPTGDVAELVAELKRFNYYWMTEYIY